MKINNLLFVLFFCIILQGFHIQGSQPSSSNSSSSTVTSIEQIKNNEIAVLTGKNKALQELANLITAVNSLNLQSDEFIDLTPLHHVKELLLNNQFQYAFMLLNELDKSIDSLTIKDFIKPVKYEVEKIKSISSKDFNKLLEYAQYNFDEPGISNIVLSYLKPYEWKCLSELKGGCGVLTVSWSPDGQRLASGPYYKIASIWRVNPDWKIKEKTGDMVYGVSWSPDGQYLAYGLQKFSNRAFSNVVKICDAMDKCIHQLEGHKRSIKSLSWSPDGQYLASGSEDGIVKIWNVHSGECIQDLRGNCESSFSWSPDGRYLACAWNDKIIRIWDVSEEVLANKDFSAGKCIYKLKLHLHHVDRLVSWSPNGKYLVATGGGCSEYGLVIQVWDMSKELSVESLAKFEEFDVYCRDNITYGNPDEMRSISQSPDGKYFATTEGMCRNYDNIIVTWDMSKVSLKLLEACNAYCRRKCLYELKGHNYSVRSISWSPDGRYMATCSHSDKIIRIWDISNGECLHKLEHINSPNMQGHVVNDTVRIWQMGYYE